MCHIYKWNRHFGIKQETINTKWQTTIEGFTSFLIFLSLGRNKSNIALSVKKPFANSNNASMPLGLYPFHEGIEFGGYETLGISNPSSKLAMIKSNPPNSQMWDETWAFRVWPTYKQRVHIALFQKLSNTCLNQWRFAKKNKKLFEWKFHKPINLLDKFERTKLALGFLLHHSPKCWR